MLVSEARTHLYLIVIFTIAMLVYLRRLKICLDVLKLKAVGVKADATKVGIQITTAFLFLIRSLHLQVAKLQLKVFGFEVQTSKLRLDIC